MLWNLWFVEYSFPPLNHRGAFVKNCLQGYRDDSVDKYSDTSTTTQVWISCTYTGHPWLLLGSVQTTDHATMTEGRNRWCRWVATVLAMFLLSSDLWRSFVHGPQKHLTLWHIYIPKTKLSQNITCHLLLGTHSDVFVLLAATESNDFLKDSILNSITHKWVMTYNLNMPPSHPMSSGYRAKGTAHAGQGGLSP